MNAVIRVDLHCHSACSDGVHSPRRVADALASDNVAVASLTDHDTVDGLPEFEQTLTKREVAFISGLEITTMLDGREAHILAYGFDPKHPELQAVLRSLRHVRPPQMQSVEGSIRRTGSTVSIEDVPVHAALDGRIDTADAIAVVHRAGGRAFLAHPLVLESDLIELERLVVEMKAKGLDGIEAIYQQFSEDQQLQLCELAKRQGLLVSAGTDLHDLKANNHARLGIDMPVELWKEFRDAVCWRGVSQPQSTGTSHLRGPRGRLHWRKFAFHIVFPSVLSLALFVVALYAVLLPNFERSLLDRKREMIRELTNSAWSILSSFEQDERSGRMTRERAQAMAISRIQALRYGREGKDYFWLQDMHPRMIMHPYRTDLNGKDVSNFKDPRGVKIFSEFASLVRRGREGYAEYVWQWKDDPSRIVPKESYIKGFQPWGWVIGTGIYVEDVEHETRQIEGSIVRTSLAISVIVALLLMYVVRRGLGLERERADAEQSLFNTTERYRSLVEATTEGTLLVTEGRCRYANPTFLDMVGRSQEELELLDLSDLFPEIAGNDPAWSSLNRLLAGEDAGQGFDGIIRHRDGTLIECVVAASRISFVERSGFILIVKDVRSASRSSARETQWHHIEEVVDGLPVGVFRARATSRGTLIEHNRATARLLAQYRPGEERTLSLADIFPDGAAYESFLRELESNGGANHQLHIPNEELGMRSVALVAVLDRDEQGNPRYIDGIVEDVSNQQERLQELEEVVEGLQTSLLFLHEPVSQVLRSVVMSRLDATIGSVVEQMTEHGSSAALIQTEGGETIGIVTDRDVRARMVAALVDRTEPVHRIMTSPLATISEGAQIYEALMQMERLEVQHLAVADDSGQVVGLVRSTDLLQFRNYGPIALLREVEKATTPDGVAKQCRRVPSLSKALLDSGAHPQNVARMISSVCDVATNRLLALAEEKFGPPPVPYAFLALGSHGRLEMTLSSDQDNAIVYADVPDGQRADEALAYMLALAEFVCEWLDRAGYAKCPGDVMASNPRWCQPLAVWKRHFTDWIDLPEPKQLLEFTIFFDLRLVGGSADICRDLRSHIFSSLHAHPSFYTHFAQSSLLFKAPARFFGRLIPGGAEHSGMVDLKDAVMPIVSFARLYALRHEVEETHTLSRLDALVERGALTEQTASEAASAYNAIMRLRMRHQAQMAAVSQKPDNSVGFRSLGQSEQAMLSQSFAEITTLQKRITYDFLGGTSV